ncbi:SsrA-binding protein SmpB [Cesiribacter andamanensis]|uniref:SsrA-binding protein n=1 Tax=Cesiribacter andamanensis AMV16 TaxID=1279009 RepID=M7NAA1_9BACT|nr:SsrA-binding protein SmpB [Cesiribacter andamanensis]EMR04131.1 SsrA-binding protein [Cesiribacter andamanensis AMV16]
MAKEKESRFAKTVNIKNKRASFEYEFLEKFVAGLSLQGTEIKSIRQSQVNMGDAHCGFQNDEMWVFNLHISPYEEGNMFNHEPMRPRKVLLKRREINRLKTKSEEKGLTIIPVRLFINDKGLAKLEIALARGKKTHDKRESIKERDIQRELSRMKF